MLQNLNIYKLIVLAIITILSASTIVLAFFNGRTEAISRQRTQDKTKIAEALKIYYDVNGFYPAADLGKPKEIENYLSFYPGNQQCWYFYTRASSGDAYELEFRCLPGT